MAQFCLLGVHCGFLGCGPGPIPDELKELRTVLGEGLFTKQTITLPKSTDGTTEIIHDVQSTILPNGSMAIAVAGSESIFYYDPTLETLESSVPVECYSYVWTLTDLDGDGRFELTCSDDECTVRILSSLGQLLWEQTEPYDLDHIQRCPIAVGTGDLDGDGQQEICVAYFGRSIACFDVAGDLLWRGGTAGGSDGGLIVESANETKEGRVLSTNSGDVYTDQVLEIRAGDGTLIERKTMNPRATLGAFDWPVSAGGPALSQFADGDIRILTLTGETLFRFAPVDELDRIYTFRGARVAFSNDIADVHIALLVTFEPEWDRAALLLFDMNGELVYRETLRIGLDIWAIQNPSGPGQVLVASNGPGNLVIYRKAQ